MTEISRGSALVTDGRSAPVQRCLWDPGGFLPIEECGQSVAPGCDMDQVASDGEGGERLSMRNALHCAAESGYVTSFIRKLFQRCSEGISDHSVMLHLIPLA